jgi:hypothetical protein
MGSRRQPTAVRTGHRVLLLMAAAALLAGCGGVTGSHPPSGRLPRDYVPTSVGPGRRFRPPATTAAVRAGRPVGRLRCATRRGQRFGAHLEIFAHDHVVAIPTGVGITPPLQLSEGRVRTGRCYYSAVTVDPTGVIEVRRGATVTLGDVFALWGQALTAHRVAGFTAREGERITAYVGTRATGGDPTRIVLHRHTRIVLEVDSHIPPHTTYDFPPGL